MAGSLGAGSETVVHQIVREVADAEGVDPTELAPLGEVIDVDAVETLFGSPSERRRELQFEYEGYAVTITNAAEVTVEPVRKARR